MAESVLGVAMKGCHLPEVKVIYKGRDEMERGVAQVHCYCLQAHLSTGCHRIV